MRNYTFPLLLILSGTGASFAIMKEENRTENLIFRQGYIYNSFTNEFDRSVLCRDDGGPVCTVNGLPTGQQVFGTDGPEIDHPETANLEIYKVE